MLQINLPHEPVHAKMGLTMYLGIDIGGTKTLIATFTQRGELRTQTTFPTAKDYPIFIRELAKHVAELSTNTFTGIAVAFPGLVDRTKGVGVVCGNLPWKNVPIAKDIARFTDGPVAIDNDANLAGLSEAMHLKADFSRVLYVTISTGIGTGIITGQQIDPDFQDSEGGHIILEHKGAHVSWESFASGSAIVRRFGKQASAISDDTTWQIIARDIAIGLTDLSAVIRPEVIVLGGSVGDYLPRFRKPLLQAMQQFATPLTPVPAIQEAHRPREAVVYGCYYLARRHATDSSNNSK